MFYTSRVSLQPRLMIKTIICLLSVPGLLGFGISCLAVTTAHAEKRAITLTINGRSASTIVLAAKPVRSAQFAAYELQYHIEKITGARLPIVTDEVSVKGARILVGESKATAALGLHGSDFQSQEYLISFHSNELVLIGRDLQDYGKVDYEQSNTFPDNFDDQGTCYAVYDFLERFCGVRWYLPTEIGLVLPRKSTLKVRGVDVRRAPVMKWRWVEPIGIPADLCGNTAGSPDTSVLSEQEVRLWNRRLRIGGEAYYCNHSFDGFDSRFLIPSDKHFEAMHSEWFARDAAQVSWDKADQQAVTSKKPLQMCFTFSGLAEQIVQDARNYFDGKGVPYGSIAYGDYFSVVPNDGGNWCQCPTCQSELSKCPKGVVSDYFFDFVNKVARQVRASHPNKHISTLAYSAYVDPPVRAKLEPNVSIQMCLMARNVVDKWYRERDKRVLASWSAESKTRRKFVWLYYCFPTIIWKEQDRNGFPPFFAHHMVKLMKEYHQAGVRGIFIEPAYLKYVRRGVLYDQVESYVTWKLADNPSLDGNKVIDEFFRLYYGAAREPMKKFYNMVEQAYSDPKSYPSYLKTGESLDQSEEVAWGYLGTRPRMDALGRLMEQAHRAARTDLEKQRVALFDKGIWQHMLAGRRAYEQHTGRTTEDIPSAGTGQQSAQR